MVKQGELKVQVLDKKGSKKGTVSLNPEIFSIRVNRRLLDLVTAFYGANQRQGNASTKTRKEIRGGGKKPWRQKGTGRARVGSIRSPIWRGGGTVFGPKPKDYRVFMSKSTRREALRSALSLRCQKEDLTVIDDLSLTSPKTKEFAQVLDALKFEKGKTVCVVVTPSENVKRASRNIPGLKLVSSQDLTAYDVLRKQKLLIAKDDLPLLDKRFSGEPQEENSAGKGQAKTKRSELAGVK